MLHAYSRSAYLVVFVRRSADTLLLAGIQRSLDRNRFAARRGRRYLCHAVVCRWIERRTGHCSICLR